MSSSSIVNIKDHNHQHHHHRKPSASSFRFPLWSIPLIALTIFSLITTVPVAFIKNDTTRIVYCFVASPLLIVVFVLVFNMIFRETFEEMAVSAERILHCWTMTTLSARNREENNNDNNNKSNNNDNNNSNSEELIAMIEAFPSDSKIANVFEAQLQLKKLIGLTLVDCDVSNTSGKIIIISSSSSLMKKNPIETYLDEQKEQVISNTRRIDGIVNNNRTRGIKNSSVTFASDNDHHDEELPETAHHQHQHLKASALAEANNNDNDNGGHDDDEKISVTSSLEALDNDTANDSSSVMSRNHRKTMGLKPKNNNNSKPSAKNSSSSGGAGRGDPDHFSDHDDDNNNNNQPDNNDNNMMMNQNDDDTKSNTNTNIDLVTCVSGNVPQAPLVVLRSQSKRSNNSRGGSGESQQQNEVAPIFAQHHNDDYEKSNVVSSSSSKPREVSPLAASTATAAIVATNNDPFGENNNNNNIITSMSPPARRPNNNTTTNNNNAEQHQLLSSSSPTRSNTGKPSSASRKNVNTSTQNNLPYRFVEDEDRQDFTRKEREAKLFEEERTRKRELEREKAQEEDERRRREEEEEEQVRQEQQQQQLIREKKRREREEALAAEEERQRQLTVQRQDRVLIEKARREESGGGVDASGGKNATAMKNNSTLYDWKNDQGSANYNAGINEGRGGDMMSVTSSLASSHIPGSSNRLGSVRSSNADATAVLSLLRYQRGRRFPGDNHNICFFIARSTNQNVVAFEAKFDRKNPTQLDISDTLDIYWLEVDQKFISKNREKGKLSDRSELTYHERSLAYGASTTMDVAINKEEQRKSTTTAASSISNSRARSTSTATTTTASKSVLNNNKTNDNQQPEYQVRLVALPTRPMKLSVLTRYSNFSDHGRSMFRNAIPVLRCKIAGEENCIAEKMFLHTAAPSGTIGSSAGPPRVTQISLHGFREDTLESVVELIET